MRGLSNLIRDKVSPRFDCVYLFAAGNPHIGEQFFSPFRSHFAQSIRVKGGFCIAWSFSLSPRGSAPSTGVSISRLSWQTGILSLFRT